MTVIVQDPPLAADPRPGMVDHMTVQTSRPDRDAHRPTVAAGEWVLPADVAALQGLRGIAVLLVIGFHAGLAALTGGWLGVSTFFTLSGFLISSIALRDRHRRQSGETGYAAGVGGFIVRRLRRLMPASLTVIAAVVAWTRFFGDPAQRRWLAGDVVSAVLWHENWHLISSGVEYGASAPRMLEHYWSLAIEEQFYVVFPVVVGALMAWRAGRAAMAAVAAGAVAVGFWFQGALDPDVAYLATRARVGELAAGMLLAVALNKWGPPTRRATVRALAFLTAAAVAFQAALWVTADPDPAASGLLGLPIAVYAAATCVLLTVAVTDGPARRALTWKPLVAAGDLSYALYLAHVPIFVALGVGHGAGWAVTVAALAATWAAAVALHRWVEVPFHRGRFSRVGWGGLVAAAAVGVAVCVAAVAVTAGAPDRETFVDRPITRPPAEVADTEDVVLLLGDSVLLQAGDELETALIGRGVDRVGLIGGQGTGPLSPQGAWADQLNDWLAAADVDTLVIQGCCDYTQADDLSGSAPYTTADGTEIAYGAGPEVWAAWETETRALITAARAAGVDDIRLVVSPAAQTTGFYGDVEAQIAGTNRLYRRIASDTPGVTLVDWAAELSPDGYADALAGVTVRHPDGLHFTDAGQRLIAAATAGQLRPDTPPADPDPGALDAMTDAEREAFARYLDTAGPGR